MESLVLNININKIKNNAFKLKKIFDDYGIEIMCITKGHCANIDIINAMQQVGITKYGDSRIDNIKYVKKNKPELDYTLIRIPKQSELEDVVKYCSCSLASELETIKKLAQVALSHNKTHDIILMVDVGDLREGVMIEDTLEYVKEILTIEGINLVGIGTNVGCYGSIMPSVENTDILVSLKHQIKEKYNHDLTYICGGSTCTSDLVFSNELSKEINLLRIGEAILFGEDSTNDKKIESLEDDAFILDAEIVEIKTKPSFPIGERGKDAFSRVIEYIDYGDVIRCILAVGHQDVDTSALTPLDNTIKIIGASSDHMIVTLDTNHQYQLGDKISFRCGYGAVLKLCTSEYVTKKNILN